MATFDALRALSLLPERRLDFPFIVVTGSMGDEAAVRCIKRGYSQRFAETFERVGPGIGRVIAREIKRRQDRIMVSSEGAPGRGATPTV
jgi:hypothetical protein